LETVVVVGRSPRWVISAWNNYINNLGISRKSPKAIRNNAHMSTTEEAEFLAPFLETAHCGGGAGGGRYPSRHGRVLGTQGLLWPRRTTCSIGMGGASLPRINAMMNGFKKPKKTLDKISENFIDERLLKIFVEFENIFPPSLEKKW
jgi:hypothetical protein